MAQKLLIRDLTLRDGQQSSFATRMTQNQIDRVLPFYKNANFYAMEVWGGAVPDSVMRYLNENPWTRLEKIKAAVGDVSKLTALSRGRNLFGYAPYTDEIIEGFSKNAIASGLGIMRIFDALNDVNNVKSTIKYVKKYGGIADCAVCYTIDPKYPALSFWDKLKGKKTRLRSLPMSTFRQSQTNGRTGSRYDNHKRHERFDSAFTDCGISTLIQTKPFYPCRFPYPLYTRLWPRRSINGYPERSRHR